MQDILVLAMANVCTRATCDEASGQGRRDDQEVPQSEHLIFEILSRFVLPSLLLLLSKDNEIKGKRKSWQQLRNRWQRPKSTLTLSSAFSARDRYMRQILLYQWLSRGRGQKHEKGKREIDVAANPRTQENYRQRLKRRGCAGAPRGILSCGLKSLFTAAILCRP